MNKVSDDLKLMGTGCLEDCRSNPSNNILFRYIHVEMELSSMKYLNTNEIKVK